MGNSASFERHINEQERYVESKINNIRTQLRGQGYSDNQIKGKLRQQYNNTGNNNDYIMDYQWRKVKL